MDSNGTNVIGANTTGARTTVTDGAPTPAGADTGADIEIATGTTAGYGTVGLLSKSDSTKRSTKRTDIVIGLRPRPRLDLIETRRTRDHPVDLPDGSWITFRVKPPGDGWQIAIDAERATVWTRRKPVAWPPVARRTVGLT